MSSSVSNSNNNNNNNNKQEELFLLDIELRLKKVYISTLYLTHYETIIKQQKEVEKSVEVRCKEAFQASSDFLQTCQFYAKNYPSDEGDKFRLAGRGIKRYIKNLIFHIMNENNSETTQQNDIISNSLAISSFIGDVKKLVIKRREKLTKKIQPITRQHFENNKNTSVDDKLKYILSEIQEYIKKLANLQKLTSTYIESYSPFTDNNNNNNNNIKNEMGPEESKEYHQKKATSEKEILFYCDDLKKEFLDITSTIRSYVTQNNPNSYLSLYSLICQVRSYAFRLIHLNRIIIINSTPTKWTFGEPFKSGEFNFDVNQQIQLQIREKEGRWKILELQISQLIEQQKSLATELQQTQQNIRIKQLSVSEIKRSEEQIGRWQKIRQQTEEERKQKFLEEISNKYIQISEKSMALLDSEKILSEQQQKLIQQQNYLNIQINGVTNKQAIDPDSPANLCFPINTKLTTEEQLGEFQKEKVILEQQREEFLVQWEEFIRKKLENSLEQERIDSLQREQLEFEESQQSIILKNTQIDQEKLQQLKQSQIQQLQEIRQLRHNEGSLIKQLQQTTEKLQQFKDFLSKKLQSDDHQIGEVEITLGRKLDKKSYDLSIEKATKSFSSSMKLLLESFVQLKIAQSEVKKDVEVNIWNEPLISTGPKKTVAFEADSSSSTSASAPSASTPPNSNVPISRTLSGQIIKEEDKKLQIKAGTLNQLLMRLTDEKRHDLNFLKTFITTFQSFTTTELFFQKLAERYNVPHDKHSDIPEEQWKHTIVLPIQLRVFNVIKIWIDMRFPDFDYKLMKKLNSFMDNHLRRDGHIKMANNLSSLIKRKIAQQQKLRIQDSTSRSFTVKELLQSMGFNTIDYFLSLSPETVANHLTMIDANLYQSIQPVELLNQAWTKNKLKYKARNVIALIERFNMVSKWTAHLICSPEKLRTRVSVFTRFIRICEILYSNLNNFNTLLAILAGINNAAVYRLKFTKDEVPKKLMVTIEMLHKLMNSNQSYKNYRETLHSVSPPILPYVGIYLTDLVFIDDGNPNFYEGLINFKKREMIYKVIEEIQQYQQTSYNLPVEETIMAYLSNLEVVEEEELWEISMAREPKGKELAELL